jgi:hypothetical protein
MTGIIETTIVMVGLLAGWIILLRLVGNPLQRAIDARTNRYQALTMDPELHRQEQALALRERTESVTFNELTAAARAEAENARLRATAARSNIEAEAVRATLPQVVADERQVREAITGEKLKLVPEQAGRELRFQLSKSTDARDNLAAAYEAYVEKVDSPMGWSEWIDDCSASSYGSELPVLVRAYRVYVQAVDAPRTWADWVGDYYP